MVTKDRGYTFVGVKQTVGVDYYVNLDSSEGGGSSALCDESLNGMYDDCSHQKVEIIKFNKYQL